MLSLGFAANAIAAEVTVFAAASLKDALDDWIKVYTTQLADVPVGTRVRVSYAGSNALARQIENGAPAQIFISADQEWMDYLAARKFIVAGTRRDLVRTDLVLVAPAASKVTVNLATDAGANAATALLAALGDGRLAVANPDAVPAGKYARAALTKLGAWSAVESKLARTENVRAALAFAARGEVPLAIVYRTDALAEPRVRIVSTFPASTLAPIVYPAAIVAGQDSPDAQRLLRYLSGDASSATWIRHGFVPVR
jgi:molybdate transport system substrate-binding protein